MAKGDTYSYIYGGREKESVLVELTRESAIFENHDIIDRDAFDQQAVLIGGSSNLDSINESEILKELDQELEAEARNIPTMDIPLDNGIPVMKFDVPLDDNKEHVMPPLGNTPGSYKQRVQPKVINPTYSLLEKTKKTPETISIELSIELPSTDIIHVLRTSLENFDKDFFDYIINNLELDSIKDQIRDSIKKHYNIQTDDDTAD